MCMNIVKVNESNIKLFIEDKPMKIEIDITKYRFTAALQIIVTIMLAICLVIAFILETHKTFMFLYLVGAVIFIFLNKYLHEGCHYIIGRLQGFNCQIKYGFKLSECRVLGTQTYKQVIALSLAPIYIYIPAIVIILLSDAAISLKFLALGIFGLLMGGMAGDFIYVYEAFRNKTGTFTDTGHILLIEK